MGTETVIANFRVKVWDFEIYLPKVEKKVKKTNKLVYIIYWPTFTCLEAGMFKRKSKRHPTVSV